MSIIYEQLEWPKCESSKSGTCVYIISLLLRRVKIRLFLNMNLSPTLTTDDRIPPMKFPPLWFVPVPLDHLLLSWVTNVKAVTLLGAHSSLVWCSWQKLTFQKHRSGNSEINLVLCMNDCNCPVNCRTERYKNSLNLTTEFPLGD